MTDAARLADGSFLVRWGGSDDISGVASYDIQVRRLPVMNRNKRLVGIVSLSDLARKEPNTAKALHGIARPSEQHNQSRLAA